MFFRFNLCGYSPMRHLRSTTIRLLWDEADLDASEWKEKRIRLSPLKPERLQGLAMREPVYPGKNFTGLRHMPLRQTS